MLKRTQEEIMASWKGDVAEPLVSVCTITYNHEPYIAEALDSFLMQETDFPFEIVVDDDCSTDNNAQIIKEYADRFPHIIKANLREKNIGMMANAIQNMKRAEGKYIALCEGDDYWTDVLKLQKQADFLEVNLECSFSGHDVNLVSEVGVFLRKHSQGRANKEWSTDIFDGKKIIGSPMSIPHTSSIFFRKKFFSEDFFSFLGKISGGDYPLTVLLGANGSCYYLTDTMSCYRQNSQSVSHSRSYIQNPKLIDEIKKTHQQMSFYFDEKFDNEINNHLIGQLMIKYYLELNVFIEKRNILGVIKSLSWMLFNHKNSQYTFLDILWLFKEKLKESFQNE